MKSLWVLTVTFGLACSKTQVRHDPPSIDAASTIASASASTSTVSSAPSPQVVVPAPFRGVFHLGGKPDVVNIVFEDDHTYRWQIFGCDFKDVKGGQWRETKTGLELAANPKASLEWLDDVSFGNVVKVVRVRAGKTAGTIDVEATAPDSDPIKQTWQAGRTCAICKDGPVGQLPCNDPIPPLR